MEEGADNSNPSVGGGPDTAAIDAAAATTAVAGFDFLDPRKPGYLARSRFKPSLRTRRPRLEGSHYPRPVWPRFSSVRRYLPISVLTAVVYVGLLRLLMLYLQLTILDFVYPLLWLRPIVPGLGLLRMFELINGGFIVWVAMDFLVAWRDRRRIGMGQKAGYICGLILLGATHIVFNRIGYVSDYLHHVAVRDDLAHPSLMLRIPSKRESADELPMTFEQCPVELLLAPDPNRGNMHVYNFREWEISPNQFKRPGALQRFDAAEMPAEMRCRAAQANPRWLLITMTNESRFTWREVVNMCAAAFEAGFERVFLNTERRVTRFRFGNVAPLPPPRIETVPSYSVAEVLPVQPTGWRQGTGRGKKGEGMVQVWACLEGETAMDAEEIGYNRPAGIVIPGPEPAHTPSVICEYEIGSGGRTWYRGWECERIAGQISRIAAELRAQQTKNDVLLWIWANGKVPYGDIAPVVQAVSQTQWDPNGR